MSALPPNAASNMPPPAPQSLLPTRPLGIGELLDRSFRLYRRHFKIFVFMAGVLMLPWTIIYQFFTQTQMRNQVALMQGIISGLSDPTAELGRIEALNSAATNGPLFALTMTMLSLITLVVYTITYLALITLAIRTLMGETPTLSLGFAGARSRFWANIRLYLLMVLIFFGVILVLGIVFAVIGGMIAWMFGGTMSDEGGAFGVIFAMCCLVPIAFILVLGPPIYLACRWSVTMPALVYEKQGARASLGSSWSATKGNVWRILAYFAIIYVLSVIVLAVPYALLQAILLVAAGSSNFWLATMLSGLIAALMNMLWSPLVAIMPTMLYFDLRLRHGSEDISQRVAALEASATALPAATTGPDSRESTFAPPPYIGPEGMTVVGASLVESSATKPPPANTDWTSGGSIQSGTGATSPSIETPTAWSGTNLPDENDQPEQTP